MKPVSPFRFPLAFDPLRLLLALRDHGIALILLTALGLAGGGALGYKLFKKNTYSVTSILRKTKDAEGFSLFGTDGYKPALLKDQALIGNKAKTNKLISETILEKNEAATLKS